MSSPGQPPSFVVLGGGPAGLAAAYKLAQRGWRDVTVLERAGRVGGNAGSFVIDGIPVDFGSHRLHPVTPPGVMADIKALLGDDLLDRPRHGRIRLRGRWVHFPLKPLDLARHLPPSFMAGVMSDVVRKRFARANGEPTFASILEAGLGRTICRDFYFPYARKIWGLPPEALDPEQAKRRVSSGSIGKMIRRVLGIVPGLRRPGAGRFFYPRKGYGQISDAYRDAALRAGAAVELGANVTAVVVEGGRVARVEVDAAGTMRRYPAAHVLSTIPLTVLARLVRGHDAPPRAATDSLKLRAMVLVYLTLEAERFTEFDAHYFPEAQIRITRLSEPKNYAALSEPGDSTILCAELPCDQDDDVWSMSDEQLGQLVQRDLAGAGIPVPATPTRAFTRRLPQAYPVYLNGYEEPFGVLDAWASSLPQMVFYGRQGLFAHDNTHHALHMAYAATECLNGRGFDEARWAGYREQFKRHVVED